ncbi:MAG: DUF4974 domain-containing protein [Niastella sp.]|nr:DUF4974 domain-containing protein [Niastella sp.]
MINYEDIIYLLKKYISGTASEEEVEELFFWLRKGEYDAMIREALMKHVPDTNDPVYDAARWEPVLERVMAARPPQQAAPVRRMFPWRRLAAVACLLAFIGVGIYHWWPRTRAAGAVTTKRLHPSKQDVQPGKDGAILTLADGTQIVLDSVGNGNLATQGNVRVTKTNGMLSYDHAAGDAAQAETKQPVYNLLSTPRGRQFRLVLPDGTRVWLNAMSSIRYPAAFVEDHRTVELTGEAYFEVAKDATKPFHVRVPGAHTGKQELDVQALGTGFNINAYDDEPVVRTTLIEGVVKFSADGEEKIMEPGQQGIVSGRRPGIKLKVVDTEQVLAWKNGYFILDGTSIQAVMRQLARWYDVEVVYEGNFSGDDFAGQIPRTATLSQVLRMLELTDVVQFEIEGKKLIISQKS